MTFADRPVTRRELLESGIPARTIDMMRRRGELRAVFTGVYVNGDVEDSLTNRAAAAARVLGGDQVICDRAAAYIHGVDAYGSREAGSRPLETCVMRGGARTRRHGIHGRERDLARRDIEVRDSLRVTTPLRTSLDLGCSLSRHRALGVMDAIARLHGVERVELMVEAKRFRGRRGVIQLRELVSLVDSRAESQRESWLRLEILDAGLPAPEVQWWIFDDGVPRWRLDLAYPAHKVAVEYDGEDFHRRVPAQVQHDTERRRWLHQHGWTVIVVTKDDLFGSDRPWLRTLTEALRPRTSRFRWEMGREN